MKRNFPCWPDIGAVQHVDRPLSGVEEVNKIHLDFLKIFRWGFISRLLKLRKQKLRLTCPFSGWETISSGVPGDAVETASFSVFLNELEKKVCSETFKSEDEMRSFEYPDDETLLVNARKTPRQSVHLKVLEILYSQLHNAECGAGG